MAREIAKGYEPQQIEPRWAEFWVKEELFRADPKADTGGKVFSLVIPPPNVTGSLHIGHMLEHTEIDILTRWYRMRGYNTLYLPGTDHAGISTQRVVVKNLMDQGIDYQKLGREEFEKREVLFPIRIDDAIMNAPQPWAAEIRRTRHIGDFSAWRVDSLYQTAFQRLLRDLQVTDRAAPAAATSMPR